MTDDKNAAEPHEGDEAAESAEEAAEAANDAADDVIEAEGPDVEVSPEEGAPFTDDDLAFLAGETPAESIVDQESELLGDLKRVQAEFVNYRKRVDRDRETGRELAIAEVVKSLLPVLDDLDRAEAHGDLEEGPMLVIAQKLRASMEKFGLTTVGEKGDVFDPHLHEALVQLPSPDVTVNTVADVVARGYLLGERLLRPAKVAVSVPAE